MSEAKLARALWNKVRGTPSPALRLERTLPAGPFLVCRIPRGVMGEHWTLKTAVIDTGFGCIAGIHITITTTTGQEIYVEELIDAGLDDVADWYRRSRQSGFNVHVFHDTVYAGPVTVLTTGIRPLPGVEVVLKNWRFIEEVSTPETEVLLPAIRALQKPEFKLARDIYYVLAKKVAVTRTADNLTPQDEAWLTAVWATEHVARKALSKIAADPAKWPPTESPSPRLSEPIVVLLRAYRLFCEGNVQEAQRARHIFTQTTTAALRREGWWGLLPTLAHSYRLHLSEAQYYSLGEALSPDWVLAYLFACEPHRRTHFILNCPLGYRPGDEPEHRAVLHPLPAWGPADLHAYWCGVPQFLQHIMGIPYHHLIEPHDIFALPEDVPDFPDLDADGGAYTELLHSAIRNKVYAIYPCSEVLLNSEWVQSITLLELTDAVIAKIRFSNEKCTIAIVRYPTDKIPDPPFFIPMPLPAGTEHTLALLYASVIHDFFVCNVREKFYDERVLRSTSSGREDRGQAAHVRFVYLPRVQVRYVDRPLLPALQRAKVVAEHPVRGHLRRIQGERSPQQQVLASAHGLTLPEGFTFVRPHRRGSHVRRTVYRSASALAVLSDATVTVAEQTTEALQHLLANAPESWFAFQRLMARLLDRRGFDVLETRATKDGGIDILCEVNDELVAVQCKFYAPDRPVGEKAVRDLAGVLKKHPEFSRAILVTTSRFTGSAIRFAADLPIELIDLLGLRGLLESPKGGSE